MSNLFNTMFTTARAKVTALWTRVRLYTSKTFWQNRVIIKIREFFQKVFDVRPKHAKDYYQILGWLVSRKLAFALIIILAVGCIYYLYAMTPLFSFLNRQPESTVRAYKYDSIPLKFYSGPVQILAWDGHVSYDGNVKNGYCDGAGRLYDYDGNMVYDGAFEKSMFNGTGSQFYPSGSVQYEGSFTNNVYNGAGTLYRESGTMLYSGDFTMGAYNGAGQLCNGGGNVIYTGSFASGRLVYSEMLGKKATELAKMYSGAREVYSSDREYCVKMTEIGAVYSVADGSNALDEEWTVDSVTVIADRFGVAGGELGTINELTAYFGTPSYFGDTWIELDEAVAINMLDPDDPRLFGSVDMSLTESFDGVYSVSDYDRGFEAYIYVYQLDGVIYTFYSTGSTARGFEFYTMELGGGSQSEQK